MRYLLYCIFNTPVGADLCIYSKRETLLGVGGQPISLIAKNGLIAVISRIDQSDLTPDIPRILAYEKVIKSFHSDPAIRGVIPMRYGCLFEEKSEISRFLEERGKEFEARLKDLEDRVEMGIRVLPGEVRSRIWKAETTAPYSPFCISHSPNPGRAYLAARKTYYEQQERFAKRVNEVAERCQIAFSGLFVKCKIECSSLRIPLLSLYFLVPRRSVEPFRKVFRHFSRKESAKLLLSGPWPPYNFVLPHQTVSLPECFRKSGQKGGFLYEGERGADFT